MKTPADVAFLSTEELKELLSSSIMKLTRSERKELLDMLKGRKTNVIQKEREANQ